MALKVKKVVTLEIIHLSSFCVQHAILLSKKTDKVPLELCRTD